MKKLTPERLLKEALHLLTSKTVWASVLAVFVSAAVFGVSYLNNVIYIVDGDNTTVTVTSERDPMHILASEEIVTTANDLITYTSPTEDKVGEVVIKRGYPVMLLADGKTTSHNWFGGTVKELLETANVELGAHDKLTHELDDTLAPYEKVEVTRVAYRSYDVSVVLPKEVVKKSTCLIRNGSNRVISPGSDGLRVDSYDEILENGEVVETMLASSTVKKEPVEELMLVGDGSPISDFDFSAQFPLDANGVPTSYKEVYHNQHATGYWRAGNPWGASGRDCQPGTVAVRANEIPYGTKMYIRTPDGKFTYGYAIANDTGTGLVEGKIDVDLFYATYEESRLNSRRIVDIYILE
ncbi:MAG: G5 domain-containing protein [Angelakisella sp.]